VICPDCKTENIPGADFCESCGHDLHHISLPSAEDEFTWHLLNDHLGDIEGDEPPVVSPGEPVAFAIHKMQQREAECVLVADAERLVGILTELDVLLKAAGDDVDLNAVTVGSIMTPDPVILRDEDTLAVALHKMSVGGFRHIPLVRHGQPTRVISIRNLFRHVTPFIPGEPAPAA